MNKINLDIKPIFKIIEVNGKMIKIPKMGLKHHSILSSSESLEDGTKKLLQSIDKNLSVAERDLVCLHLLAYNGKLKNEVLIDGDIYTIEEVKISQQLKFFIGDVEFKFKTPNPSTMQPTIDKNLNDCCVSVRKNGIEQPIPDFMHMPAYTYKWMENICNSISLKTKNKEIKGLYSLMEVFNGV